MTDSLVWDKEYTGTRWTYGMTHRPPGYGHQPDGRIVGADREHPLYRYGVIQYPRPLTPEEVSRYELAALTERELAGQERIFPLGYGDPTDQVAAEVLDSRGTVVAYVPEPEGRESGTWPEHGGERTDTYFRRSLGVTFASYGAAYRVRWNPGTERQSEVSARAC